MKRFWLITLSLFIFLAVSQKIKAQQLAVKSNVPMLLTLTPNVGFEFVAGERTSVDISAFANFNFYGKDVRILGLQPEFRYWFNGRPMVREYLGISVLGATYDITWGKKLFDGDAIGAGITMGYSLNLNKHWNVEFYGGFGAVYFRQKQYYVTDNFDDYTTNGLGKSNAHGYKLLPIKIGVSVSYIIK